MYYTTKRMDLSFTEEKYTDSLSRVLSLAHFESLAIRLENGNNQIKKIF